MQEGEPYQLYQPHRGQSPGGSRSLSPAVRRRSRSSPSIQGCHPSPVWPLAALLGGLNDSEVTLDEKQRREAASATASARGRLDQARVAVIEARKSFGVEHGWILYSLNEKLEGTKLYAAQYKELKAALDSAEAALTRAETACSALDSAIMRSS